MTEVAPNEIRTAELGALGAKVHDCTVCRLAETRTNVVFGAGNPDADVIFIGEGPGQQEDEQGLPFVGRSGQLLEKLLGEIGLTRDDVYIANVVKCRPPKNRDPRPDEIDACKDYLRQQLELIQPKAAVTLGNFSSKLLLRTDTGITKLRGQAYEWWGRLLVPTFHPAAALRGNPRVLADMQADFQTIQAIIEGKLQRRPPEPSAAAEEPDEVADPEQLDLFPT
ncbi:MAG: uracil-DNA glycosylase [bacterium]|nr:uracil-DNA glycosylase [bacterium]